MKRLLRAAALLAILLLLTACGPSEAFQKPPVSAVTQTTQPAKSAAEARLDAYVTAAQTAQAGEMITFGAYEQDGNTSNGSEPVEWLVLAAEEERLLVISRYGLAVRPYHTTQQHVTWETSALRAWLNDGFLTAAFSEAERALIPAVTVAAHPNPKKAVWIEADTEDQVFLLSMQEAKAYFPTNEKRKAEPTQYAVKQGAYTSSSGACLWWLRTAGSQGISAVNVTDGGSLYELGVGVDKANVCIRPAMWINRKQ